MRGFFGKMLSSNKEVSSKRVITTTASALVFVVVVVDLFTDLTVTEYIFEGLIWMAIAGLGSTALESFANRPSKQQADPYGYNSYGGYGYSGYANADPPQPSNPETVA